MSVIKLLGRICDSNNFQSESEKHNKTFGIASDSLTQFVSSQVTAALADLGFIRDICCSELTRLLPMDRPSSLPH